MRTLSLLVFVAFIAIVGAGSRVNSQQIYAGPKGSPLYEALCSGLASGLRLDGFRPSCVSTRGAMDNITQLLNDPTGLALVSADALANWSVTAAEPAKKLVVVRGDIVGAGIYLISKDIDTFDRFVSTMTRISFVLPPKDSDAAQTFDTLRRVEPRLFAHIESSQITYAESASDAIAKSLTEENTVALLVQLPDPGSPEFKAVIDSGGHFIPVLARSLLDQKFRDLPIYSLETHVVEQCSGVFVSCRFNLWRNLTSVTTIATPVLVISRTPDSLPQDPNARQNYDDMLSIVRQLSREKLLPASWLAGSADVPLDAIGRLVDHRENMLKEASHALPIYTSEGMGTFDDSLCVRLAETLSERLFFPSCVATRDPLEQLGKLRADELGLALVSRDVYASWLAIDPGLKNIVLPVRSDIAEEGVYFISRNISDYDDIARADHGIRFVLPPERSSSVQMFKAIQRAFPEISAVVGRFPVTYAPSLPKAIEEALKEDNTVTVFAGLADSANPAFTLILNSGGHFISVPDVWLRKNQSQAAKVYSLTTLPVEVATLLDRANPCFVPISVTTLVTPVLILAHNPAGLQPGSNSRINYDDMTEAMSASSYPTTSSVPAFSLGSFYCEHTGQALSFIVAILPAGKIKLVASLVVNGGEFLMKYSPYISRYAQQLVPGL